MKNQSMHGERRPVGLAEEHSADNVAGWSGNKEAE